MYASLGFGRQGTKPCGGNYCVWTAIYNLLYIVEVDKNLNSVLFNSHSQFVRFYSINLGTVVLCLFLFFLLI